MEFLKEQSHLQGRYWIGKITNPYTVSVISLFIFLWLLWFTCHDSTSLFLDIGNNNGNFLRPSIKKLSIISKIDDEDIVGIRLYVFTYKKLENATDCFSKNKLLSKGRFGEVYIGYIEFTIVTIKKFTSIDISGKQEDVFEEIKDIGSSVQHRNLVNLIGYCDDGFNKLLVYEFVHKESSLRCHLHGMSCILNLLFCWTLTTFFIQWIFRFYFLWRWITYIPGNGRSNLDWPTRLHIALSIARGLIKLQGENYYVHVALISFYIQVSIRYVNFSFFFRDLCICRYSLENIWGLQRWLYFSGW